MRLYQIGSVALVTGGLIFAFQNCAKQGSISSANQASPDSQAMRSSMAALKTQILTLGARDLSCATDADCAVVPVGSIHCGAPTFRVLTSSTGAHFPDVLSLANEYGDLEKSYVAANQVVGTCEAPVAPTPFCVASRCVAH